MAESVVREAAGEVEMGWVRELMRAYAEHLAANPGGGARICIAGYEDELRGLPGVYAPPAGALLVAMVDGVAVGCCGLKPAKLPGACEMKRLYVGPAARGLGLGRRLIEAAIAWARAAGYMAMVLDTAPAAMASANALYRGMGFIEIARYNDNPVPGIAFYRLEL